MALRLLIVEDDTIQLELLKEAFEQRGFVADTATDGLSAISKLNSGQYDAALIDYRIPEMDGLASARVMHKLFDEHTRPKLIAITGDAQALSGEQVSSQVFNAIVPKSLDLVSVVQTVEQQIAAVRGGSTGAALWQECGLVGAPAALVVPEPTRAQKSRLRGHFEISSQRASDLVLLADAGGVRELADLRLSSDSYSLPFIDLTGAFGETADATFLAHHRNDWVNVAGVVQRFAERRRELSERVLNTGTPETRLLAYLFLSGKPFEPSHDASCEKCVRYPGFFPTREAIELSERLAARGLLERRFADRFHVCDRCRSFRLNVREECPSCRSANLREVPILHHYRCAHQAPEPEFMVGRELVCPKCRQRLRHYGSEYDKPGHAVICSDCGATHSEPAVGFICLDCRARMSGERAPRQDVFAYHLSDAGIASLTSSSLPAAQPPRTSGLPQELEDEIIRNLSKSGGAEGLALAEIRYANREHISAQQGASPFEQARRIFLSNMTATIPADTSTHASGARDFILARCPGEQLEALMDRKALAQACLAIPLNPQVRLLDPALWIGHD